MERVDLLRTTVRRVLDAASEDGSPVTGGDGPARQLRADAIVSRLTSRSAPEPTDRLRVLTNFLIAKFEREPSLVGRLRDDYEWLVSRVLEDLEPLLDD